MNNRLTMFWGLGAVTIVLAGGWVHSKLVASRSAVRDQAREELAALQQEISEAPSASTVRAQLAVQSAQWNVALPVSGDLADLLAPLAQDLSALTNADRSLVTNAAERANKLNRVPLLLNFESPFPSVFELLARVEAYARIVRVRQLVITRKPESDGSTVSVSARFLTFARTDEESW